MEILDLKIRLHSRYIDYQKLVSVVTHQANPRRYIGSLIKKGYLIRVKKGLYLLGKNLDPSPYSKEILANLIYGPSYVSLEYALAFYGLIPERVETLTSISCKKSKQFTTPVGMFDYFYLNKSAYSAGVQLKILSPEQSYLIATPEKALLDTIAIRFHQRDLQLSLNQILEEDLRIDLDSFQKLNLEHMTHYATQYKSSAVKMFMKKIKNG